MTPKQAYAWTDNLLTRISRSYTIHYRDDEGLHAFTLNPGATLSDVSIVGAWPDENDAQITACREFVAAVAADPHDGYLAIEPGKFAPSAESVGLTEEELAFASETEFAPNAPHQLPVELLAKWEREDEAEADQDELLESRRTIGVEFRQLLGRYGPALQRQGFGQHIRELSAILAGDESEFDPARADELLSGIQSFALSLSNSF